jgi:hypothetical protein
MPKERTKGRAQQGAAQVPADAGRDDAPAFPYEHGQRLRVSGVVLEVRPGRLSARGNYWTSMVLVDDAGHAYRIYAFRGAAHALLAAGVEGARLDVTVAAVYGRAGNWKYLHLEEASTAEGRFVLGPAPSDEEALTLAASVAQYSSECTGRGRALLN